MRISENSFFILDVSPYDSKELIIQKCNSKISEDPEQKDSYEFHKDILLNPSDRLLHEIRWFYSEDLAKFERFKTDIGIFENKAFHVSSPLSAVNLLIYTMTECRLTRPLDTIILSLIEFYKSIEPSSIRDEINEARGAAGLPIFKRNVMIEEALNELLSDIKKAFQLVVIELYHSKYIDEVKKIAENISKDDLNSQIYTDILSLYYSNIQDLSKSLYDRIAISLEDKDDYTVAYMLLLIDSDLKKLCDIEWFLEGYAINHNLPLYSIKVMEELRALMLSSYENEDEEAALNILKVLKECSAFMPIFHDKILVDSKEIEKTYTSDLYNEYFEELSKILSIVQTNVISDNLHIKENLSFYENTFKPKYKKYIDRITKEISFDEPEYNKISSLIAHIYIEVANALAYKHAIMKAEFCIRTALHYANLSHDIELINIVKTRRQSIKMDLKEYKKSKEINLKKKSVNSNIEEDLHKSNNPDYTSSENVSDINTLDNVDGSDNLDNSNNSDDSSTSGGSTFIGCLIILVLLGIAYAIGGFFGIIVVLFILYKIVK